MVFKVAFSFLSKMFHIYSGSFVLLSGGFGAGIVYVLKKMATKAEEQNIYIIATVQFIGLMLFFLFLSLDLMTGLSASRYKNAISVNPQKNYIKSYKLYRTGWKFLGVMLLSTMLMLICLFSEAIDSNLVWFLLWFLVSFWVLACSFEFHSIGENIEKRTGSKPEIFEFWEKIAQVVERKTIKKVESSFDVLESDPEDKPENNMTNEDNTTKSE